MRGTARTARHTRTLASIVGQSARVSAASHVAARPREEVSERCQFEGAVEHARTSPRCDALPHKRPLWRTLHRAGAGANGRRSAGPSVWAQVETRVPVLDRISASATGGNLVRLFVAPALRPPASFCGDPRALSFLFVLRHAQLALDARASRSRTAPRPRRPSQTDPSTPPHPPRWTASSPRPTWRRPRCTTVRPSSRRPTLRPQRLTL